MTVTIAVRVAQAIILPLVGLTLGTLARRTLGPKPTRVNVLWSLSLACACLGLVCWPNLTATTLDRYAHVPGLGHLATATFTSASFVLQFAFTCAVAGCWTWRRYGAVMLYGMLAGLYIALWLAIHNSFDVYRSYNGWPPIVLATNLTLVALIGYAAAIGIYGYAGWLRDEAHSSERIIAGSATTVFTLAGVYVTLVLGQTIASLLGLGSTEIMGFTGPITLAAGSIAAGVIWVLTGERTRSLRAYAQLVFALRQREVELEKRERAVAVREELEKRERAVAVREELEKRERAVAVREEHQTALAGDIADLAVWVEDHLIQIHVEVDERPVADMATWSAATGQSAYQRTATLMTTRLTLLAQARVLRLPRYDLDLLPDEDEDQGQPDEDDASMAENLPQEVEERENLLSDVLRLLQLVDPQPLPEGIEPREEPPGWRRDAATAITETLRRYGLDRCRQSA